MSDEKKRICQVFTFAADTSKSGRVLSSVRIGGVYMSRLVINPGVTTGNVYHKKTRVMMYVEKGSVIMHFVHIRTKQKKQMRLLPGVHVIHIFTHVAHATKNIGKTKAVLVFFTSRPLRDGDDYPFSVV